MTTTTSIDAVTNGSERLRYGSLIVMMAASFLLVTAEFLPNGVLTEMASSLGVTPGQAGQTVTATAFVGLIVAPTVGLIFPRLDRRTLLVWMALAAAVSNLAVAVAPNLVLVLIARFLLGASLSAFWSMSIRVAERIAGPERLGRAISFTTAGVSLATVAGVPLGVMLSQIVDWRTVFGAAGLAMGLLAIALRLLLPSVPAAAASSLRLLLGTLRRPGVGLGLAGHMFVVLGHALAYTYVRLALERIPDVTSAQIVMLLGVFGMGGLVGNIVFAMIVDRRVANLAVVTPLAIAGAVAGLIMFAGTMVAVVAIVFVWGGFFASWLIVINTWTGKTVPDQLEAGGSLVVVGFQASITLAAGGGGAIVDLFGVEAVYATSTIALLIGAILFVVSRGRVPASAIST